ncbi:NAD(P)/FAD-dependent oxidoreductase [Legionella yabuuchiae]|uniref:NAD(P)/FAD-dependent oxidoreductase n=1 Tax=Legionella yabuuchiae TaxID=376727 RepID=UPI0010556080|nr:NAD(P)/FAD-dependent oxidoreductase [Legionella yabuuchiae]
MTEIKDKPPCIIDVLCIGAGPAGLTAGYLLGKQKKSCLILEKDTEYVGGISRTVQYKGFRFDIGGHRFFSKSSNIEALWEELLGDDFIERPRKSRIFYQKKFFTYPLKPLEALWKLGLYPSCCALLSYLRFRLFPIKPVRSFQDWVTNHFGRYFFQVFFKTYTEKVWGMACTEISADWAAQRIKGLSLISALKNACFSSVNQADPSIKTLITHFRYPKLGPGMMWEAAEAKIQQQGNRVELGACVTELEYQADDKIWRVGYTTCDGKKVAYAKQIISSMPIRELVHALSPSLPAEIIAAADRLKYRDFLLIALIVNEEGQFDDNWIYIHDPSVKVGRIQNFRSWSPYLIPTEGMNCYGLEYFCFEGDGLWTSTDEELLKLAKKEIYHIGLVKENSVIDGCVVRQSKAYPIYDDQYKTHVAKIRDYLNDHCSGLHLVGRNGMHKYNNQDHAMMTAKLTVENILANKERYNVWNVNEDAEYHEDSDHEFNVTERLVPQKIS